MIERINAPTGIKYTYKIIYVERIMNNHEDNREDKIWYYKFLEFCMQPNFVSGTITTDNKENRNIKW